MDKHECMCAKCGIELIPFETIICEYCRSMCQELDFQDMCKWLDDKNNEPGVLLAALVGKLEKNS